MNFDIIVESLKKSGVVPVIKLEDTSKAIDLAGALLSGGITCAEVTFRASGADRVISDISKAYSDMTVGAGTVLTVAQAEAAINAGAKFLVAPGLNEKVVEFSLAKGVPFIPGIATPTEAEKALDMGLKYVKFFPAEQNGGLAYIKAISAPYSELRFMPTGGINDDNIIKYLEFDKVFACGGSWMVTEQLIKNNDWGAITSLSKSVADKIKLLKTKS